MFKYASITPTLPLPTSLPAYYLYELQCDMGLRYVGITNDLDNRMKHHFLGTATRFTQVFRPSSYKILAALRSYKDAARLEEMYVIKCRMKGNFEVFGGSMCSVREALRLILPYTSKP